MQYLFRLSELGIGYCLYTEEHISTLGLLDVIISLLATSAEQEAIRVAQRTKAGPEREELKRRGRRTSCARGFAEEAR